MVESRSLNASLRVTPGPSLARAGSADGGDVAFEVSLGSTGDIRPPKSFTEHAIEKLPNPTMDDQNRRGDGMAQHRSGLGDAWVDKSAAIPNHGAFGLLNTDD